MPYKAPSARVSIDYSPGVGIICDPSKFNAYANRFFRQSILSRNTIHAGSINAASPQNQNNQDRFGPMLPHRNTVLESPKSRPSRSNT